MLITALEKEREELYARGMEKGLEKGLEKGVEKEKIEAAKIMFAKGMSISLISEITGLSEKELLKLQSEGHYRTITN